MEIEEIKGEEELGRAIRQGIGVILFRAPWFALCRLQEPILRRIALKFKGKANIGTIDIDQIPETALNLGIQSVPTLIIFENSKEIQRFVGIQSEEALSDAIGKCLEYRGIPVRTE